MFKNIFYGWWIVLSCFVISLYVAGVGFYGFTAFFEPIKKELGWSYTQISFAASLRGMEMGILAPFIGFLVDRLGSRNVMLCGAIVVGFGLILLSFTQSLVTFYIGISLLGFGAGGCTSVVSMSAVANWFHKKVGIALGVVACGFGFSGLIVPLIVWLISTYGWRSTLIILGLGIWAIGVPLSLVIRNKPEQYGYLPDGELPREPISQPEIQTKGIEIAFRDVLKKKSFLALNIVEVIRFMSLAAVVTHIMPYLANLGIPRFTAGLVAAAIPLISITGRFGFGWLSDVFDKRQVMAWSFVFMAAGMLALRYMQVGWVAVVFLLLFSSGFGGGMVLRGSVLRGYFGRDSFGKALGITMGASSIGGIIGPTLAGWAFDTTGSYQLVWLVFCGLIVLATGAILKFMRH